MLKVDSKDKVEKIPDTIKSICDDIIEEEKKLLQHIIIKFIK